MPQNRAGAPFDLEAWLNSVGLGQYLAAFRDNDVAEDTLPHLTADDLTAIGIVSVGHRRRLLMAIDALRSRAADRLAAAAARGPEGEGRAPEATPLVSAERRLATIVFCDLVDSTALTATLGSEAMHELLGSYKDLCTAVIGEHGGHLARFLGDGILASFGYPRAKEDDAIRAVRVGLALALRVGELKWGDTNPLAARVGIATGFIVAGQQGSGAAVEKGALVGDAVNLAARLQAEAGAGQVFLSATTAELIGSHFECAMIGQRALKGFASPVTVCRAIREVSTLSRFASAKRPRETQLVGRAREIDLLLERHGAAASGHGQVVLISGEPGVGKSRLVEELHARLGVEPNARVVLQCMSYHSSIPFYPIRRFLAFAAGIAAADRPDDARNKLRALLSSWGLASPETAAIVAELLNIAAGPTELRRLGPWEVRARTFKVLLDLVEAATRGNALLILEDVHWADPSTIELLSNLAPLLPNMRVMLVATTRPRERAQWISETEATIIDLRRFHRSEARRLVETIAGSARISQAIVETIVNRSDGVPIFIEELTRALLEAGGGSADGSIEPLVIPSTLTESLLARLDRLEHGREITQIAAVIGRSFPIDLLIAVADKRSEEVRAIIGQLMTARIFVREQSAHGEAIGFSHMLLRDAAYQVLLQRDRARLHKRVAETIETRFPGIADDLPHVLALQFTEAGAAERAIPYWQRAGIVAWRRSATSESISHLSRAIELVPRLPPGDGRDELELDLLVKILGPRIAVFGWSAEGVKREVERALELCKKLDAQHRMVPVLSLKWLDALRGERLEECYTLAQEIDTYAAQGNAIDRLLAARTLGSALLFRGEFPAAVRELEGFQALYAADQHEAALAELGATKHAVTAQLCLAEAYGLMGIADRTRTWRAASLEAANDTGHLPTICQTIAFAGGFLAGIARDADELDMHAAELKRLSFRHELPFWRPHAELLSGLAAILRGEAEQGLGMARPGIEALVAQRAFLLSAWCILYADMCEIAGYRAEGFAVLAPVAERMTNGERWLAAEFHRLRAMLGPAGAAREKSAAEDLSTALRIARAQHSAIFEQRALAELEKWTGPQAAFR
ncbi:MAG TPA: AAA family ATPase [Alphaproteobacteria bacterium]|nr:AAA family ATPase [Alphaproteobacteria bacterium]